MGKPTVHDIAREAGVSLATVDRVLNARPGVRQTTVGRVRSAVEKLGYVRDPHAVNLARQRQYRFAFVLPEGPDEFVDTLTEALREAGDAQRAERVSVDTLPVRTQDPHAVVRVLRSLAAAGYDGVAIMAPETPQLRDAIARLAAQSVAVVALVSDLPNCDRHHFVGVNSLAAGRTAALLMGRFVRRPGKILAVTNSMLARDSIERRIGFDSVIARSFPQITVLPSVESHDDAQRIEAILSQVLSATSDLVGVYAMGPGNETLVRALRRVGRLEDLVIVVHELTPEVRGAMVWDEVDVAIAQNVGHLMRSALRVLRAKCDGVPIYEAQEKIRIDVILRENLP